MSDNAAPAAAPAAPSNASPSDATGDTQQQGAEQPQGKEKPAAPKARPPKYHKVQLEGGEEVTLSDEDVAREYKKWRGSDAKFREAAEARKSVEAFMQKLQEDPESVLNDPRLPLDRKKLAEKWLFQQIEAELKPADPRDKKLSEMERQLKEFQDKEAQAKQSEEEQARTAEMSKRKEAISNTLAEAMQATQLSQHPESAAAVLREMALYMRAAKERGEEVTPQELVEHVHNSRFQQFYTLANQFEGDQLIEFLGEEVVNRIRKADLARLRAARDPGQQHRSEREPVRHARREQSPRMDAITAQRHAKKMFGV